LFFVCDGSEAVESTIKMAPHHYDAPGGKKGFRIIARWGLSGNGRDILSAVGDSANTEGVDHASLFFLNFMTKTKREKSPTEWCVVFVGDHFGAGNMGRQTTTRKYGQWLK
jgi:adenosylmethionine-8-amino-7-oxononanoate aminotransferase